MTEHAVEKKKQIGNPFEHEKSFVPAEHYSHEAKGLYSSVTYWVFVNNQHSAPMEPKSGQTA